MGRTLEFVFRRPKQFLALLVVLPLLASLYGFVSPRTYQSTATLWALRPFEITGATWAERWYNLTSQSSSDPLASPASTQADALTQLTKSWDFDQKVATTAGLANQLSPDLRANPAQRDQTIFNDLSHNVKVTASSQNLVVISYTNGSPQVAQRVVAALISTYESESLNLSITAGQNLLQADQNQLPQLQAAANATAQQQADYAASHRAEATRGQLSTDGTYLLLSANAQNAQSALFKVKDEITTLTRQLDALQTQGDGLYSVQDPASLPASPQSRMIQFLLGGVTGLVVGLLLSILYLTFLFRGDRSFYSAAELQDALHLPVLLEVPSIDEHSGQVLALARTSTTRPLAGESWKSGVWQNGLNGHTTDF